MAEPGGLAKQHDLCRHALDLADNKCGRCNGRAVVGDVEIDLFTCRREPESQRRQGNAHWLRGSQSVRRKYHQAVRSRRGNKPPQPSTPCLQRHVREERKGEHRVVLAEIGALWHAVGQNAVETDGRANEVQRRRMNVAGRHGRCWTERVRKMPCHAAVAGRELQEGFWRTAQVRKQGGKLLGRPSADTEIFFPRLVARRELRVSGQKAVNVIGGMNVGCHGRNATALNPRLSSVALRKGVG